VLNRLCLATVVLLVLATPLHAQTTQTSIEIEATIGLDGWIDHSRPVPVEVTIRSEVLFAGTLEFVYPGRRVPAHARGCQCQLWSGSRRRPHRGGRRPPPRPTVPASPLGVERPLLPRRHRVSHQAGEPLGHYSIAVRVHGQKDPLKLDMGQVARNPPAAGLVRTRHPSGTQARRGRSLGG
jgi:hypothetical protein